MTTMPMTSRTSSMPVTSAAVALPAANREAARRLMLASLLVLLSAICVQKPRLAFQHAKLAAEEALTQSGIGWSIVRRIADLQGAALVVDRSPGLGGLRVRVRWPLPPAAQP